ncbi:ABC transporter substrate-binding protein [Spiractinospora alimapuensis]|uniref:ABC transporter substrate-binding protein n=1 Tax=Spiractinospora alimapuensis TaxID=2820884 RepID=UPI001F405E77|nr:ABC transporter substrate-binding protein [Spiractinospora alimapuensis]QVQ53020.1 ABC transporter substrate-binding protein [Spiractinospora alimapuensis]
MPRSLRLPLCVATLTLAASACGGGTTSTDAAAGDPVTVDNCGTELSFGTPPERVILLESAPVSALSALGVLDSVVLRAGAYPEEYYDDATNQTIQDTASLGDDLDESGHLEISQEVIIAEDPDLVMGLPDGITRESLDSVGIPALVHPVYCPEGVEPARFDDVYDQVESYGRIFDRADEADEVVTSLRERVETIERQAADEPERTAAVLFPTVGGGTTYAYGSHSMADPQLAAAGLTNVFGDVEERVFEVATETLVDLDPDVLVLLHVDGDPEPVRQAMVDLPGADSITAVQEDAIHVQLFNFTEPPTPLAVDGLERIAEEFGTDQ